MTVGGSVSAVLDLTVAVMLLAAGGWFMYANFAAPASEGFWLGAALLNIASTKFREARAS